MPRNKQPKDLRSQCVTSIVRNIERHWIKMKNDLQLSKPIDDPETKLKYIIGPFEVIDDQTIACILKQLYQMNLFNKNYLYLCLHSQIKSIDLSFIRKKNFFNAVICNFIGNNCYNVVELNLSSLNELPSRNICLLINSMKYLRKLDLSHTKITQPVTKILAKNCHKLEYLNLENCKFIFDDCIEDLMSIPNSKLHHLNVDNINLSDEIIEKALHTFKNLKFLYVSELVKRIQKFYIKNNRLDENGNELENEKLTQYNLETVYIDPEVNLKALQIEALMFTCPHLKNLRINCLGQNEALAYLDGFNSLTELTISNFSLQSFKFGGYFLDCLKSSLGKKLRVLSLIHLPDVNMRYLAKYCSNLVKLNIEFLDYYNPFTNKEIDNENEDIGLKNLRYLSINNTSSKYEKIHLNIGQFKKDLINLLKNGQVKFLHLSGLNELDEEFFQCLFSTHAHRSTGFKFIHESIEIMELKEMNTIGSCLIMEYLLNNSKNCLKELALTECKLISRFDSMKMRCLIKENNLDCVIKWS
ncbi:unnamed protein product [Brachionus calyciflorus]|uniref:Uncharacterized protein n=1 Tax=Brachionus calyciflorus TaxID=104777 RepID=A0A813ZGL7_9BILA|nr:unnamed protein product [Brachionus calyciflorus]